MAEEAQDPVRIYPKVLFGGLAIAGVLYFLVTVGASMVVPTSISRPPTARCWRSSSRARWGSPRSSSRAIGLLALANGALINMIMASRLLYGMSREGVMPKPLGIVHPGRRTPWVAILFTSAIAVVLVIDADLEKLADTTVALLVMVFAVVHLCVLVLRREEVDHDHFRVPWVVPVIGIAISLALLTQIESKVWPRVGILLAVGLVLWCVNWLLLRRQGDGEPKPG